MITVVFYNEGTGRISMSGSSQDIQMAEHEAKTRNERVLVIDDAMVTPNNHYVKNGVLVLKPAQPSKAHYWDWPSFSWILDLDVAKTQAKDTITKARNKEESSGFTAFGKVFDSDSTAVQRISVGVQAANAVGESYTVDWSCMDNTTITLDYWMMLALPAFMANDANTLHVKARTLKEQIDTATTLSEIENIIW